MKKRIIHPKWVAFLKIGNVEELENTTVGRKAGRHHTIHCQEETWAKKEDALGENENEVIVANQTNTGTVPKGNTEGGWGGEGLGGGVGWGGVGGVVRETEWGALF